MAVCALVVGLWAVQASGSQANQVGAQLRVAAASDVGPAGSGGTSTGVKPGGGTNVVPGKGEGAMRAPGGGEKSKDVGGMYCTRTCMMMPDLWDQSCTSVCTE
jgi:hypothetical protein